MCVKVISNQRWDVFRDSVGGGGALCSTPQSLADAHYQCRPVRYDTIDYINVRPKADESPA